jgi:hypothetical protein
MTNNLYVGGPFLIQGETHVRIPLVFVYPCTMSILLNLSDVSIKTERPHVSKSFWKPDDVPNPCKDFSTFPVLSAFCLAREF